MVIFPTDNKYLTYLYNFARPYSSREMFDWKNGVESRALFKGFSVCKSQFS